MILMLKIWYEIKFEIAKISEKGNSLISFCHFSLHNPEYPKLIN